MLLILQIADFLLISYSVYPSHSSLPKSDDSYELLIYRQNDELRKDAVDALCCLAYALGEDFTIFIPSIHKLLLKYRLRVLTYSFSCLISLLVKCDLHANSEKESIASAQGI